MREIRFRAWAHNRMYSNVWLVDGDAYDSGDEYFELYADRHLDNAAIMQFTGLQDSEGVDLYEGDLLSGEYGEQGEGNPRTTLVGEIVFRNGAFRCDNHWRSFDLSKIDGNHSCRWVDENHILRERWYYEITGIRVIGNIYENPELLK